MPRGLRRRHLAPSVLDGLFLGQRIVDAREDLDILAKHFGQRMGAGFAPRAVVIREQVQRRLDAQRLAVHVEGQPGGGLVKEPVPCRGADHGIVVQETLELIGKLIGAHGAHAVKDRLVARRTIGGGEDLAIAVFGDAVEFEAEEHELGRVIGDAVLQVAHLLGARRIGGVLVIAQPDIGHQPADQHVDLLIALDAFQHLCRRKRDQPPLEVAGEIAAGLFQRLEVARQFRSVGCRIKIRQIPVGQHAQIWRVLGDGQGVLIAQQDGAERAIRGNRHHLSS